MNGVGYNLRLLFANFQRPLFEPTLKISDQDIWFPLHPSYIRQAGKSNRCIQVCITYKFRSKRNNFTSATMWRRLKVFPKTLRHWLQPFRKMIRKFFNVLWKINLTTRHTVCVSINVLRIPGNKILNISQVTLSKYSPLIESIATRTLDSKLLRN